MIPQNNRLPKGIKITSSNILKQPHFFLKYTNNNLSFNRYAFVVSKKIDKRAVVRNRSRRILREIFLNELFGKEGGIDMVIVVTRPLIKEPREKIEQEVKQVTIELNKV